MRGHAQLLFFVNHVVIKVVILSIFFLLKESCGRVNRKKELVLKGSNTQCSLSLLHFSTSRSGHRFEPSEPL